FVGAIGGHDPDTHRARGEAALARRDHCGEATELSALAERLRGRDDLVGVDAAVARQGIERTRLQWKVFLQQSNAFDLARRERRVVAIAVSFRSVRALELAERRQRANALALRFAAENVDRLLDAELRRRR